MILIFVESLKFFYVLFWGISSNLFKFFNNLISKSEGVTPTNFNYQLSAIVTRLLCLVKSCALDAAAMRVCCLFISFTFCKTIFSCSLISKERIYIVPFTCVSLIEMSARFNLYWWWKQLDILNPPNLIFLYVRICLEQDSTRTNKSNFARYLCCSFYS